MKREILSEEEFNDYVSSGATVIRKKDKPAKAKPKPVPTITEKAAVLSTKSAADAAKSAMATANILAGMAELQAERDRKLESILVNAVNKKTPKLVKGFKVVRDMNNNLSYLKVEYE